MLYKVCILTYGCPANKADSEIMAGLLKQNNFDLSNSVKDSDLNIINTCTVKSPTLNRMIHKIRQLTELDKPLIITGCITKTEKAIIEKVNPKASMLGPDSVEKIVDVVNATIQGKKIVFTEDLRKPKTCLPRVRRNPVIDIIPISIGCLSNCSYCSVKLARGKLFSYSPELIVKEAKQAIIDGCKEFYITSQDNGCYGFDIGTTLSKLLNEICKIEGKFFVRVGMMNPLHVKNILDELIQVYRNEKIFKFLHLPVQSGSDKMLELMKRGYKVKDFLDIVRKFRRELPMLTLSTDIIVGFPGETQSDYEKTVELIEEVKSDIVNISKFGARPGTEAAKMKQLDRKIINERSVLLTKLVKQVSLENNKKWLGWNGMILIDERGTKKDTWIGRNFVYKPIVIHSPENLLGRFVNAEIIDVKSNYLIGKMVKV